MIHLVAFLDHRLVAEVIEQHGIEFAAPQHAEIHRAFLAIEQDTAIFVDVDVERLPIDNRLVFHGFPLTGWPEVCAASRGGLVAVSPNPWVVRFGQGKPCPYENEDYLF
jgi:hypothetical protein